MRISKIQNQNDYLHKFASYLNLFIQINIKFTVDNKNAKKAVELVNLSQNPNIILLVMYLIKFIQED